MESVDQTGSFKQELVAHRGLQTRLEFTSNPVVVAQEQSVNCHQQGVGIRALISNQKHIFQVEAS